MVVKSDEPDMAGDLRRWEEERANWEKLFDRFDTQLLVRATIEAIRQLALPTWRDAHPTDVSPRKALEAAEMCLRGHANGRDFARAAAKACTVSRKKSLGDHHGIADAAKSVALAASETVDAKRREGAIEALSELREYILYRHSIPGVYGKENEVEKEIVGVVESIDRAKNVGRDD